METKEKTKLTKSSPIDHPDNAQLNEKGGSVGSGETTSARNKDSSANENQVLRADNIVNPNTSDNFEDKSNDRS